MEDKEQLTLVLTFDRATHGVGIGGTVPDFATAVDQRRVSSIISGVRQ